MVPPFMNVKGPMFCLQINGEVVWESRKVYSYPRMTFYLPQRSILPLGCIKSRDLGKTTVNPLLSPPGGLFLAFYGLFLVPSRIMLGL